MSKIFEILIFTASIAEYAQAIINEIDPEGNKIEFILDRSHCMETKGGYFIKDLRIIQKRHLKDLVIVDNLVQSFGLQLDNGIPILEWKEDINDNQLLHLEIYLTELSKCNDVRKYNIKHLKLRELANSISSEI